MITVEGHKKKTRTKYVRWLLASVCIYFLMRLFIMKFQIADSYLVEICAMITDVGAFSIITLFGNLLVYAVGEPYFRLRVYAIEVLSVIAFVTYLACEENQAWLWLDIILFVIIFLFALIRDSNYLNIMEIICERQKALDVRQKYLAEYSTFTENVEAFNKKEDELLQARLRYASDEKAKRKAINDKREISISGKWDPQRLDFPEVGEMRNYMGVPGLFGGLKEIRRYEREVSAYEHKLNADYEKYSHKKSEIVVFMEDADNVRTYIEGTESEKKLETLFEREGIGQSVDRAKRAKNSYKTGSKIRKWYGKKNIDY